MTDLQTPWQTLHPPLVHTLRSCGLNLREATDRFLSAVLNVYRDYSQIRTRTIPRVDLCSWPNPTVGPYTVRVLTREKPLYPW